MKEFLIEWLQCPACQGQLHWDLIEREADYIETAVIHCHQCRATYEVREGIGSFLTDDLPREDLWQQVDSNLIQYLRANPAVERALLESRLEALTPADQFFRALALEEQGQFRSAKAVEARAKEGLYTQEHQQCEQNQTMFVLIELADVTEPIVDIASGRGVLVEQLLQTTAAPIIATDFSPRVLRRDRQWLIETDWYDRVSFLAFDARQMPFKDGAVKWMTTNLGLPNIQNPAQLFGELRRVLSGKFLAISQFFPENDGNEDAILAAQLEEQLYRKLAISKMKEAGLQVQIASRCLGRAKPTPPGKILDGAMVDGLPQVETEIEWCVLEIT